MDRDVDCIMDGTTPLEALKAALLKLRKLWDTITGTTERVGLCTTKQDDVAVSGRTQACFSVPHTGATGGYRIEN